MPTRVRYWWVDEGDSPSELPGFPYHCHKFIVLREEDGSAHVIAADSSLDQHADIYRVVAAHLIAPGPDGALAGGGRGGEHFPGRSEAFGMPPEDVVAAIQGTNPAGDAEVAVPDWMEVLIESHWIRSIDELLSLPDRDPTLSVHIDAASGLVEIERFDTDWNRQTAALPLRAVQLLLARHD